MGKQKYISKDIIKLIENNKNLIHMKITNIFNVDPNMIDLLETYKDSNKAFVYIVNMDKYTPYISQLWNYLSNKEKEQASRYRTNLLTTRYIISHGVLRYILSHHTKILPQYLKFVYSSYGKPFLDKSNIQFNMSHSHNMVGYIVNSKYNVGIDIEYHDNTIEVIKLSELVLTTKEFNFLKAVRTIEKHKLFYQLWTKKESLIKAIGIGLSYPVNTIEALPLTLIDKVMLTTGNLHSKQELYSYIIKVGSNYSGSIAIDNKVNEIVYIL